jgi:iron uptake system EfeUOB component EfeO/EfeM
VRIALTTTLAIAIGSCGTHEAPNAEPTTSEPVAPLARATIEVDRYVDGEAHALTRAAEALCAEGATNETRRARWRETRLHYERIEGAISVLFPETDADVDDRYERVAELRADTDPFDGEGFIGMHAIERVLWGPEVWARAADGEVVRFESALVHVAPPIALDDTTRARFEAGLCARLVRDLRGMEQTLDSVALDPSTAWRGVLGSIEEQAEKVRLGTTGQSESRYAGHTLADMRGNLEGGLAVLEAFASEIEALPDGSERLQRLREGFARLEQAYRASPGDDLPAAPSTFDPDHPRQADRATPYGRLFVLLAHESDPEANRSLAYEVRATGRAMGIAELGR